MSPPRPKAQRSSNIPADLALPSHSFDQPDSHSAQDQQGHTPYFIYPHSTAAYDMSRAASSGPTSVPASGSRSQPYQLVSPGTPADPRAMSQVSPGFIFVMFPMFACFDLPSLFLFLFTVLGPSQNVSFLMFLLSSSFSFWSFGVGFWMAFRQRPHCTTKDH